MLERLSNRILIVGGHPFRFCMKHPNHQRRSSSNTEKPQEGQDEVCCCSFCQTHSPLYARCWPAIFLFSAITDFPMPLPQGKKPGQHRDWGWLPVLVVLCLVAFMYYTYLTPLCLTLFQNGHRAQAIVYLVPLHLWVLMFLCSYARVVLQKPGSPKKSSTISPEETVAKQDKTSESPYTSLLGGSKWCEACQCWKPDRTHHCRVCDACVLKMDHHCPWVNGCVGYANYRYFIQFLCYTSGMATWVFTTTLAAFIMGNGLTTYSGIVIALIILSGIVMIAIGTFTCSHLWLVTLNRTTIENIQFRAWNNNQSSKKPDTFTYSGKNVFNQGTFKNWTEVMGDKWWQWFFPIAAKTRCNGVNFGYNSETLEEYQRARS